jgi:hypothetical protein
MQLLTTAPLEGTPFLVSYSQYPDFVRVDGINYQVRELGNGLFSDLPSLDRLRIWTFRDFSDCPLNLIDKGAAKIWTSYIVKIGSIVELNLSSFVDRYPSAHLRHARARVNTSSAG